MIGEAIGYSPANGALTTVPSTKSDVIGAATTGAASTGATSTGAASTGAASAAASATASTTGPGVATGVASCANDALAINIVQHAAAKNFFIIFSSLNGIGSSLNKRLDSLQDGDKKLFRSRTSSATEP